MRYVVCVLVMMLSGCSLSLRLVSETGVPRMTVSPGNKTLLVGQEQKYTAERVSRNGMIRDKSNKVTWSSSNPSVALFFKFEGNSTIIAVGHGTTIITATVGSMSSTATVTVVASADLIALQRESTTRLIEPAEIEITPQVPLPPIAALEKNRFISESLLDADMSVLFGTRLNGDAVTDKGMQLHGKYDLIDHAWEGHAEGRVRWNEAYADTKRTSNAAREAYRLDTDWRELYVSTEGSGLQISAGLQQVVWGRADNLRILDQVNPLDFREFILPDLNDYRRAVFMLRAVAQVKGWTVESVYLPWFVENRYAVSGSEFFIPTVEPLIEQGFELRPTVYPKNSLESGEVGIHASRNFDSIDFSGVLFYTRDDDPVYRVLLPETANEALALQPEYHRQLQVGAGLAKVVAAGFVVRNEFSYIPAMTYNTRSTADGLTKSATLRGLLGIDYPWRDWLLSLQASDRFITDWKSDYFVLKHQPIYTFSSTGNSFSARLETRFAVTAMSGSQGQLWQLKNVFKPNDRVHFGCVIDLFNGDRAGFLGQFSDSDRVQLNVKYLFL